MPDISVVIPVYKAENSLHELYDRLKVSIEKISEDFEIILADDCSPDRSWETIEELSKNDRRVRGLSFSRNFGQHYAITAGLDYASGDWVVIMDCDLQDRPEEIPRLYEKALEGYDVVLARRKKRKDPLLKRITSNMFYRVFNYLADTNLDPGVGNYRIISKKVVESFSSMRENLRFLGGLIDWMGFPTACIDVRHVESKRGSTYTFGKLWKLGMNIIIAYSDKPLRLSVNLGFLISFISLLAGIYFIIRKFIYNVPVLGWTSLIVSLLFIGGIIIANLGIIGIYLGKTFDETKKRPLYIVSKRAGM